MSHLARLLVLSVVFLLLFLIAALFAQTWMQRQHMRLQAEAITAKRQQFLVAAEFTTRIPNPWSDSHLETIGQIIDAHVQLNTETPISNKPGRVSFSQALPASKETAPESVIIEFDLPHIAQLSLIHGRTWGVLLLVALSLMLMFIATGLWFTRRVGGSGSRPPVASFRADMSSWMQLARTSVAQGTALAEERDSRQRIEKDLSLHQILQNQALEEKIRLGRDLHDGVIQSLYAVGLTIEAARPLIVSDPSRADKSLQDCLTGLNRSIRDVRQYITGLSPEKLRGMSFADAVKLFVNELSAGRTTDLELVIDEDAAVALSPAQSTEALQVTHEAISNALRHGEAREITVRLHRSDSEIGLLVRDNGKGFDTVNQISEGHGLANMRARAENVGASLRIDSQPEDGTRVVMTFPVTNNL